MINSNTSIGRMSLKIQAQSRNKQNHKQDRQESPLKQGTDEKLWWKAISNNYVLSLFTKGNYSVSN